MKLISAAALWLALSGYVAVADTAATNALASGKVSFEKIVSARFTAWDLNHDGVLSTNEIDAAVADRLTTNENAAAIAALKRATRRPKNPLPPLTLENILKLTGGRDPDLVKMFREGCTRIESATNRALFGRDLPRLETIHQGKLGNCFCLAPLGAMVHRDPAQVASMFCAQSNGNYSVKLGKHTVEISTPSDAEIAMTSSNEHDGMWVNIYEKAVGEARNEEKPESERAASPLDALARGGSAGTMLALITGHEITRFSFKFAKDTATNGVQFTNKLVELREQLALATAENRLMTCGTIKTTTPDITPNHAYAVFKYDPAADSVQLWNPHGQDFALNGPAGPEHGYATKDGVFWIPVTEFVKQFSGMAFEVTGKTAVTEP